MSNRELSIDELEGQRAVLLPPREELKKKKKVKQEGLVIINTGDINILSDL